MDMTLPDDWRDALSAELTKPYIAELAAFVDQERTAHTVFPPEPDVFNALKLTPLSAVKVVILGQDPYHNDDQAHGLSFSVRPGIKPPPSLRNILKELQSDLGIESPKNEGYLGSWAEQGVLLLNTVLTVRAHEPASHKGRGWETFTDAVIGAVAAKPDPVVFVLWGAYAQKKEKLLAASEQHIVISTVHPSPLSAKSGFFASKPFSKINEALEKAGETPVDWRLVKAEVLTLA